MRTTLLVLAATVLIVVLVAACRTRDESVADSTADDSARADGTAIDSGAGVHDTAAATPMPAQPKATPRARTPEARTSEVRRVEESARDSALPPEDSIRAMRPHLPQVTPEKRPRTWRGFKLPEERPVPLPLETTRTPEQRPDSAADPDSTKPPKPAR